MAKRLWRARNTVWDTSSDFPTEALAQSFADRMFARDGEPYVVERTGLEDTLKAIAARPGVTTLWDHITINRWAPDTCRCVIEQWFDDDVTSRTIAYASILRTCPEHTATGETLWDTINGENRRKNAVLAIVQNLIDLETREDKTTWAFSSDRLPGSDERVLEVTIASTTRPQRDDVEGAATVQFGAGSVRVL